MNDRLVEGRDCIWITGASSGIGRAVASLLVSRGYRVAASARRRETLEVLAQELANETGEIRVYPIDVTDHDAVAATRTEIESDFGPIGLALLNAGTHREVMARDFSAEDVRALIDLNVMGCVNCLEAVLPEMIARGRGHLALVSSVAGYMGLPTSAGYGATKAGLINMAEALKPECDRLSIKLQLINPGFVKTPLTDRNPFPMPFLMNVDDAARAMVAGLESRRFEVIFPRRLAYILKALRLLPYPLFFALTRRLLPVQRHGQPDG
ncbi:SDR family NAD(P)-dependent oxidoreductase [Pelagibius sp. Alg239-R121]|uniref:SDR family NAD(P)-dependent oxidoreductase n=1 Tax=Pelagibius sp. Alg239-R121 TaxID=2993448 RepID=UPI0024A6EFA5|nr:SDR family NAD(P)-dependent oxidoreductase [Pelagibius sp. Alg239-R121]